MNEKAKTGRNPFFPNPFFPSIKERLMLTSNGSGNYKGTDKWYEKENKMKILLDYYYYGYYS